MYIANLDEVKRTTGPKGKTVAWLLSQENGTPNFEMRYFEVPKTDLLFNTLCQINILPNIETYNMKSSYKFKNFNNAFDYFRNEFFINNSEQEEILRNYLKNRIEKENGHIKLKGSTKYAVVWWDKNRN